MLGGSTSSTAMDRASLKGDNHISCEELFLLIRSMQEYEAEACEWKPSQVCLLSFLHHHSLQMQLLLCFPFWSWYSLLVTSTSQKWASEIAWACVNDLYVNVFKMCSCNIHECCKGQSGMLISHCVLWSVFKSYQNSELFLWVT